MTGTAGERLEREIGLTIEHALYGLIALLALALRLFALGRWPLSEQEASLALAAWRFARGIPTSLRGYSPLLFHLNALLFFITGGSDSQARLWCVLFGSSLVFLPYGLRRYLGRIGALAAAVMLAVSPSFTYFSRAVDGSIIVAFAALGLLVASTGYLEERRSVYGIVAVALVALALMAGPLAYTMLALFVTFPFFRFVRAKIKRDETPWDQMRSAWLDVRADSSLWRRVLVLSGLLFLVLGLAFLYNPLGLQMTLDQLGQWFGGFIFLRQSPWYHAWLLFFYESLALFLGIAGFLLERRSSSVFALLLRYWAAFAFLFSIVPGYRPPSSVLLLLLPFILAAGQAFERMWYGLRIAVKEPLFWSLVALSLVVVASAYVQFVSYLTVPVSIYLLRIAALCVFSISAYALLWSIGGHEITLRAAVFFLLLLLSFVLIRTEVRLNYIQARDPREPIVGTTISPEVLELAQKATEFSSHLQGDPKVMPWQVDERLEIPLGWYLRYFEQVTYVRRVTSVPEDVGVILPAGAPAPAKYVGLHFDVRSSWPGGKYPLLEWLRWWLGLKTALPAPQTEEVVLWVRSGL